MIKRGLNLGRKGNGKSISTNAGNVAVLVILMALFIVVYVMMLSPEDRNTLLFNQTTDNQDAGDTGDTGSINNLAGKSILSQTPGKVTPFDDGKILHRISPVEVYIKDEPVVSDLSSMISVKKTFFSEKVETLSFKVESPEEAETATLYFNVKEGNGGLIVNVNGQKIFDSGVSGIGSIVIPAHILKEDNVIILKSSSVGANIFGKNCYTLTDIKARIKYELVNAEEKRTVILGAGETGDGKLDYFLYCKEANDGDRLRVFVNEKVVSDSVVSCISGERNIEINRKDLLEGKENEINFVIEGGNFLLNDIKLEVESETPGYVEYKFPITEKEYKEVYGERIDAVLKMEFSGDLERKATITVNGNEISLDTDEISYEKDITRFIKEGNNYIRITPKREFIIDSLDITFED
jgi:hypothetical protein